MEEKPKSKQNQPEQPPLIPAEPSASAVDPDILRRQAEERQKERRQELDEEAKKEKYWER